MNRCTVWPFFALGTKMLRIFDSSSNRANWPVKQNAMRIGLSLSLLLLLEAPLEDLVVAADTEEKGPRLLLHMVWRTAAVRNKAAVPVGVRRRDALLIMAGFFSQNQSVASLVVVTLPSSVCRRAAVPPCRRLEK